MVLDRRRKRYRSASRYVYVKFLFWSKSRSHMSVLFFPPFHWCVLRCPTPKRFQRISRSVFRVLSRRQAFFRYVSVRRHNSVTPTVSKSSSAKGPKQSCRGRRRRFAEKIKLLKYLVSWEAFNNACVVIVVITCRTASSVGNDGKFTFIYTAHREISTKIAWTPSEVWVDRVSRRRALNSNVSLAFWFSRFVTTLTCDRPVFNYFDFVFEFNAAYKYIWFTSIGVLI